MYDQNVVIIYLHISLSVVNLLKLLLYVNTELLSYRAVGELY